MTPNDVKSVLHEVLGGGVFLNTSAFIVLVSGWLVMTAVAAGVGSFFAKRGETAAVKRDIETIKRNLGQITSAQKRWDIKWDCYSKIAEYLGEIAILAQELVRLRSGLVPMLDPPAVEQRIALNEAKLAAAMEKHRRFASVARIVVAPEVRTFLSTFADEWNSTITIEGQFEVAHKAWLKILDVARADLLGEPSEFTAVGEGTT